MCRVRRTAILSLHRVVDAMDWQLGTHRHVVVVVGVARTVCSIAGGKMATHACGSAVGQF